MSLGESDTCAKLIDPAIHPTTRELAPLSTYHMQWAELARFRLLKPRPSPRGRPLSPVVTRGTP